MLRFAAVCLVSTAFFIGCDSEEPLVDDFQSISLNVTGFSPARSGEIYALWLAFPKAVSGKKQSPQHGSTEYKLVSTFDITSAGALNDFVWQDALGRLPGLELAQHGLVSIEKKDSVGDSPRIRFLVGEITGTASTGNAVLTIDHGEAVGYTFSTLTAKATLASPSSVPNDFTGELYLMDATDPDAPRAGISGLVPLPLAWKYGMWAVDSATKSLPPFNIFYGYFSDIAQVDSNPDDNRFTFPGGRYPAPAAGPVYKLNTGQVSVMVTLEPNFGYVRPQTPFGAILLKTVIPSEQPAYTPFDLSNTTLQLPQASLIIDR